MKKQRQTTAAIYKWKRKVWGQNLEKCCGDDDDMEVMNVFICCPVSVIRLHFQSVQEKKKLSKKLRK